MESNNNVIKAMAKYIEDNGYIQEEAIKDIKLWKTAKEWSDIFGIDISTSRLTSMYNNNLILRAKDKKIYKDNVFHYWPKVLSVCAW